MTGDPEEDSAKLTTQSHGHYPYALPVRITTAFLSSTAPCGPKSVGTPRSRPVSRFQEKYKFGFLATPTPSQSQFLTIPRSRMGPKPSKSAKNRPLGESFSKITRSYEMFSIALEPASAVFFNYVSCMDFWPPLPPLRANS